MQAQGGPSRARALGRGTTEVHISERNPRWPTGGLPAKNTPLKKKIRKKASWMLLGSIFIPPWNLVSCLPVGTWWLRKRRRRNKVEEEEANFWNVHFPQKDVEVFESLCPGGADLKQRRGFASSSKKRRPNYNSQLRLSVALCIADCHAGCWLQNKFPKPGVEPRPGSYCCKKTKSYIFFFS